ncbi:MAG: Ig-like domain-containing protein [bacterium]|nr:Ig-like domain-containing protein [bacterium]
MRSKYRLIHVFLLTFILVFNLCATTTLGAETETTYEQTAIHTLSAKKQVSPSISKTSCTLVKSQTTTLKIKNATKKVTWSSSNTKVASVNKSGKVTAKSKGKATITAKVGSKKLKCAIKVETPKINCSSVKLNVRKKKTLSLSGNSQRITWSSSSQDHRLSRWLALPL